MYVDIWERSPVVSRWSLARNGASRAAMREGSMRLTIVDGRSAIGKAGASGHSPESRDFSLLD